ncbi:MAG: hypothetical protein HY816_11495 [Candidatus Wallbacteria bacterium]|nr:hypothetical protein [Candidatus Wallbacteria bacterium]
MKVIIALLTFHGCLALSAAAQPASPSQADALATTTRPAVLVYATARLGEAASCGCAPERGGLARQAVHLARLRRAASVGLVEAGDTFFRNYRIQPSEAPKLVARARGLAGLLSDQGLLATAVGECDLAVGLRVLKDLASAAKFPVLAANLVTNEGERPFAASAVVQIGSLSVGLIGLVSERLGIGTTSAELRAEPPAARFRETLAALSPRPDRIVVLAHMPPAEAEQLFREVPGADLAILGHGDGRLAPPRMCGSALLVGSDLRGRELGEVELTNLPTLGTRAHRHVLLSASIGEEPAVAERVRKLEPLPARP